MARHSTLAAGLARLLAGPLVGRTFLMRCLAALAGNLALLETVHRGESAILFSHTDLLPHFTLAPRITRVVRTPHFRPAVRLQRGCHASRGGCAKSQPLRNLATTAEVGTEAPVVRHD